jgi:hypothetical protein
MFILDKRIQKSAIEEYTRDKYQYTKGSYNSEFVTRNWRVNIEQI